MAVDERSRHDLYTKLEQVLGHEHATVLMEHLPPVGWADVATKRDLEQLEERLEYKMLATFRAELNAQTRTMITAMVGITSSAMLAVAGLAFVAARLV
ncbi:MAG: hypothetical protein ACRDKB_05290 [Actinomycetota bacterium]